MASRLSNGQISSRPVPLIKVAVTNPTSFSCPAVSANTSDGGPPASLYYPATCDHPIPHRWGQIIDLKFDGDCVGAISPIGDHRQPFRPSSNPPPPLKNAPMPPLTRCLPCRVPGCVFGEHLAGAINVLPIEYPVINSQASTRNIAKVKKPVIPLGYGCDSLVIARD
jgi:hypothetical protein